MASIPWWVWLGLGVFVAVSSTFVSSLKLFIWVGLIFIVIGIAKVTFLFVMKPKESKSEKKFVQQPQSAQFQKLACPRCRASFNPGDYFCRFCGLKLR